MPRTPKQLRAFLEGKTGPADPGHRVATYLPDYIAGKRSKEALQEYWDRAFAEPPGLTRPDDTTGPPIEINNPIDGRATMQTTCYRRGQGEVGIVTHGGRIYAAFGASVHHHNITAYTRREGDRIALTRWDGSEMLSCRSVVVREFHDGSLALLFRLTNGRYIVGYVLGDNGMLFRGELLVGCDDGRASREAVALAEYWSGIDDEDEADPWHGEPDGDLAEVG